MSRTLDAAGDVNYQTFDRLSKIYGLPDYVKQANSEETLTPVGLPAGEYADIALRQFPCHTKAACYVSSLFLLEHGDQLSAGKHQRIQQRLLKAAEQFGIAGDVAAAMRKSQELGQLDKEASLPDSAFAIVLTTPDGGKDRRYPLRNSAEITKAAHWLMQYRDQLPFPERNKLAVKILDKAAEHSVSLPEELDYALEKQAGRGVYDPAEAVLMIRNRANCRGVAAPVRMHLEKLAAKIDEQPLLAEDPTTTLELATTLDQFDRAHGLTAKYAEGLSRPEDVLFKGSLKYAAAFVKESCHTITGSIYEQEQFSKLSLAVIRESLGSDLADAVSTGLLVDPEKMAEVASTLPLPDAHLLDQLMKAAGQPPVRSKAADCRISEDQRRQLVEQQLAGRGRELGLAPSGVAGSRVIG